MSNKIYISANNPTSATVQSDDLKLIAEIDLDCTVINLRSMTLVMLPSDYRAMEVIAELAQQIRKEAGIHDTYDI